MGIKKTNQIFGYSFFIVGVAKLILCVASYMTASAGVADALNGRNVNVVDYSIFATLIGLAEIILFIGAIVMIIRNSKKESGVIPGYLCGIGAILMELFFSSIFSLFFQCSLYATAGSKIISKNNGSDKTLREIKQNLKNTEWFYNDQDK